MITITLVYADGSTWFAGGFNNLADATNWIDAEKTRSYWKADTQIQITDNSVKVEDQVDVNQT